MRGRRWGNVMRQSIALLMLFVFLLSGSVSPGRAATDVLSVTGDGKILLNAQSVVHVTLEQAGGDFEVNNVVGFSLASPAGPPTFNCSPYFTGVTTNLGVQSAGELKFRLTTPS